MSGAGGAGAAARGEPVLQLRFPARADRLGEVRSAVRGAASRCGCSEPCTRDIVMAVDEACQNIIRHAYGGAPGEIVLEVEREADRLVFWLRDFAPPVDVSRVRSRPLEDVRPGGLGVHLIREVMDEAGFEAAPDGEGNLFRMAKRIA